MSKKIIILCGLPCTGKSHYCDKHYPNVPIISNDLVVEQYAKQHNITYNVALNKLWQTNIIRKTTQNQFTQYIINKEPTIIIDNTHMTVKSRARFSAAGYEKHCIVFECSDDVLNERNLFRSQFGKSIPLEVFTRMKNSYIAPTHSEGFTSIKFIRT